MRRKWPIMLRSEHNALVTSLVANLDVRKELIDALNRVITTQRAEIAALKLPLEAKKCNDYTSTPPEKPKRPDPVMPTRSGWRSRAQMLSEATIPVVGDSPKPLEL